MVVVKFFQESRDVATIEELRSCLALRHAENYGSFWLRASSEASPALAMFVNRDQACLFFYREHGDPGLHSLSAEPKEADDEVDFLIDNYQQDLYPRFMIVRREDGEAACEQFFASGTLPTAIEWLDLGG